MLGKQLKLFTISQLVGSGLILWMPKGATVRGILETFIKDELLKRGYSAGLHPAHRPAGAVPHQRPLPVLPRRAVPADVLQRRRPARSTCASTASPAGELDEKQGARVQRATCNLAHFTSPATRERQTHGGEARSRPPATSLELLDGDAASICRSITRRTTARTGPTRCSSWLERAGRLPAQADELPAPHPDLQGRAAQLPRPAGAAGRVRHRLPLRADRRARRHDPRPRLHPGRRPPVRHPRAGRGGAAAPTSSWCCSCCRASA